MVETYQDPASFRSALELSGRDSLRSQVFNPVLYASPTTNESDSASGLNLELSAPQFLGSRNSPSQIRSAIVTLPPGLTVNPDAADGQSCLPRRPGELRHRGPRTVPGQLEDRDISPSAPRRSRRPLEGSVFIGEPQPGDQYRLFMIADRDSASTPSWSGQ